MDVKFESDKKLPKQTKYVSKISPFHMNTKWTEYATEIINRTGEEATFKDLVAFVQQQAETASNIWGVNLLSLDIYTGLTVF